MYEARIFNIPELKGISKRTIDEHMKLYQGYVKHTNLIHDKIKELSADAEGNAFMIGELRRRLGFEFDGMRNHEYYFEQLEGGSADLDSSTALYKKIVTDFGSFEDCHKQMVALAMTRGVGWAICYYDSVANRLLLAWVEEQQLGHLTGLHFILGLDMWEHSYMLDYAPSEKKKYIEAFFQNINGKVVAERFEKAAE